MTVVAKRKDSNNRVLKEGEYQRPNGTYSYRWKDNFNKAHMVYAKTLEELRDKERDILYDSLEGIKSRDEDITFDEAGKMWFGLKRGIRKSTMSSYKVNYDIWVKPYLGDAKVSKLRRSDIKQFYLSALEERNLSYGTLDSIALLVNQILEFCVDDGYIRANPASKAMKEISKEYRDKRTKRVALTANEQKLFLECVDRYEDNILSASIIKLLAWSGLRIGEACGLRWCDIDFKENYIDVNHTLLYYKQADPTTDYHINPTKSKAGTRLVPMLPEARKVLMDVKRFQKYANVKKGFTIDGYTDFVFLDSAGRPRTPVSINTVVKKIVRWQHKEAEDRNEPLLPKTTCHTLRHTFCTRMCEAGVNIKVIQDVMGHSNIQTTLNVYTDASKDFKKEQFEELSTKMNLL